MLTSVSFKIGLWNAWIFMSVFIWQMIIIIFADKYIRKRTHVPKDARRTTLERYVGIVANFFWLLALGYSVFLPLLLGTIWFYIGFPVFIFGVLLLSFATLNFMTTPADRLIQKGVYKFSRHPMYLATFLICLGSGIATASGIFILLSVIMAVCFHYEALVEERYCLAKYKDLYKEYMNTVPRWFGLLKRSD
jgi:protein-S-isoprenylcysteine O-methyltransferase Ste14